MSFNNSFKNSYHETIPEEIIYIYIYIYIYMCVCVCVCVCVCWNDRLCEPDKMRKIRSKMDKPNIYLLVVIFHSFIPRTSSYKTFN